MIKLLIVSAALATFAGPVLAQTPTQPTTEPHGKAVPHGAGSDAEAKFTKHDADADGALSLDEVKMVDSKATQADFDQYDADRNMALSKTEFAKWIEARTTPPASTPG
jgi:hypothetical protein